MGISFYLFNECEGLEGDLTKINRLRIICYFVLFLGTIIWGMVILIVWGVNEFCIKTKQIPKVKAFIEWLVKPL